MDLPLDFKELLAEFAHDGVEFLLVGGYAVAFHGRPRATKDIDLVLEGSEENLKRAAKALMRFGAPANVVRATESMQEGDVAFMGQPPLRVDLMRSIDGVSSGDLFSNAVMANLDGVSLRVISLPHLIANKKAVARPQDLIDAEFLEKIQARTSQK